MSREERIEGYYHWGTRELATRLVDAESTIACLEVASMRDRALIQSLQRERTEMSQNYLRLAEMQVEDRATIKQLEERSNELARLEARGVDNWDGYYADFGGDD